MHEVIFFAMGLASIFMTSLYKSDKNDVSRLLEKLSGSLVSGAIFRLASLFRTVLFPQDGLLIQINFHNVWHGRCVALG